jgi:hypothetical protein
LWRNSLSVTSPETGVTTVDDRVTSGSRAPGGLVTSGDPEAGLRVGLALRVPLFTAVTCGLGVGAHLLGGGRPPSWSLLALILVAVALVWRVTSRAEQSLPRLVTGVLGLQLGIHLTLSAPGALPEASAADSGHTMAGVAHTSPMMWLAHGLAAVAVAAWLRGGEAALWRAVRRVVTSLSTCDDAPPVVTRAPSTRVDAAGDARPDPILLLLGPRWRGPPRTSGPVVA